MIDMLEPKNMICYNRLINCSEKSKTKLREQKIRSI